MVRATRGQWAVRVRDWKRSELTAAEYAVRAGLNANTLRWWSSELARTSAPRALPPVMEVVMAQATTSALEVVLPTGARVMVPVDFDEATLRRLLSVLEGR